MSDRHLALGTSAADREPLTLPADDLTTHAVCIGMTGSGKTGFSLVLLEELGRGGVPVIAIDTKGDLVNLALLFDQFRPEDFAPWLPVGSSEDPAVVAARWRDGLAAAGITGADLAALRAASPRRVYTPGSDVGTPVDVLAGLRTPGLAWEGNEAELRSRISTTVSALCELVNVSGDPLASPEHLLLSHLLEDGWRTGREIDLPGLIRGVQAPPFTSIGVFEVDTVLPEARRMKLALALNTLLASPSFQAWQVGVPLGEALWSPGPDGRPPTSILYLAHLSEPERHFFLALFLESLDSWMRRQGGSSRLRLLLFCDEVVGYLPPHPANPPTKGPLLKLFKQARAFGVGVLLATQNPVDLDYKALTNAGTWLIGRLRTQQDRDRLGEALASAVQAAGGGDVGAAIEGLASREFLVSAPSWERAQVVRTRWAMSYLAGPLTLPQLSLLSERGLVDNHRPATAPAEPPAATTVAPPPAAATAPPSAAPSPAAPASGELALPEPVRERQWHLAEVVTAGAATPQVLVVATVRYEQTNPPVQHRESVLVRCEQVGDPALVAPKFFLANPAELREGPPPAGCRLEQPAWLADASAYRTASRLVSDRLYDRRRVSIWYHDKLNLWTQPGESPERFEAECQRLIAQRTNEALAAIATTYDERLRALQQRLEREQLQLEQRLAEAGARGREELLDSGAQMLGMLLGGRRRQVSSSINRAARNRRQVSAAQARVEQDRADVAAVEQQIAALLAEREAKESEALDRTRQQLGVSREVQLKPRRRDITIEAVGLLWLPADG